MKSLNKKIAFVLAALVVFSSTTVFASGINNDTTAANNTLEEEVMTDAEINEIMVALDDTEESWLNAYITYNVYDANDNLVMSMDVKRSEPLNSQKLSKLIAQSDFLMTYNNTKYFRLKK